MSEKQSRMDKASDSKLATRKPPRQMAAKACERCRRRKIKCDEFFPCGQCTRMRVQCKIEDPAEKRREQQQSAMEDRIKRLEALLVATYTNPNNQLDMNIPGLDTEGLIPGLGGSPQAIPKPEPPRLTLQTPGSLEFRAAEPIGQQLLSAEGYSFGIPYWSPPSSIGPSAPTSASDYYPSEVLPWSSVASRGSSTPGHHSPRPNRTRTSSMSTSETSQDDMRSPIMASNNRLSVDTSGSTLGIPQIAVTSWDQSRPQSPAPGMSPALSPQSVMDMETPWSYPPELSIGSWSGLSSPVVMATSFPYEDHLSVTNQSLPSHSRRSSINSLNPSEYDVYNNNEPKRRRAASDLFPVPNQFIYPETTHSTEFFAPPSLARPNTPNLHPSASSSPIVPAQGLRRQDSLPTSLPQLKDDIYTHTFHELITPLFPLSSPQQQNQSLHHPPLSPQIAQTQTSFLRAISTQILHTRQCRSLSSSSPQNQQQQQQQQQQTPFTLQAAHSHLQQALRLHSPGKWDSLPGIQSGIFLAIYILISTPSLLSPINTMTPNPPFNTPNLYLLNATIVAAVLDLGLHQCRNLQEGGLEANTLLSAYVLDRTVAKVRGRPALLKDSDLSAEVGTFVRGWIGGKVVAGVCVGGKRGAECGRLWEWWGEFEARGGVDEGQVDMEMDMEGGYGFGDV